MIKGTVCISDLDENGLFEIIICGTCGEEFKKSYYATRHLRSCGVKLSPRESYEQMVKGR